MYSPRACLPSSNNISSEVIRTNKSATKFGYTKSVDMWSLGCLTSALLNNGDSVFVNTQDSNFRHDSAAAITRAAAKCDLSLLDHSPAWKDVQAQAKEFVKGLLQLNENARMSAEQALKHAWFTQGPRKAFFQGKYRQAIRGWKRTINSADFIEDLNILIDLKVSSLSNQYSPVTVNQAKDRIFAKQEKERLRARQMPPPKRPSLDISSRVKGKLTHQCPSDGSALASRKRRQSTLPSPEEVAIHTEAGKENRGFISAKLYSQTVAKKRLLKREAELV